MHGLESGHKTSDPGPQYPQPKNQNLENTTHEAKPGTQSPGPESKDPRSWTFVFIKVFNFCMRHITACIQLSLLFLRNMYSYSIAVSCTLIASDKSNLLKKVHFFLKSGFQVIVFYILLEIGYLCYNCRKLSLQMITTFIFGKLLNNF